MKHCECGCGLPIDELKSFLRGHNRRKPPKPSFPCECGCGTLAGGGQRFLVGHNARVRSEETRQAIGNANSSKMQKYFADNPDVLAERVVQMQAGRTEEVEVRRKEATRQAYEKMTAEELQKFSTHTAELWKNDRPMMVAAAQKGANTRKVRREQYITADGHGSEKWRNNISKGITQKYLDGGFEWSRGAYVSTKSGQEFYYRSSWELRRMHELDLDGDVISWDYEPFSIEYVGQNGNKHRYVPDFIIRTAHATFLEEVGPHGLKESADINVRKRIAAEEYCRSRGFIYRTWEPCQYDSLY